MKTHNFRKPDVIILLLGFLSTTIQVLLIREITTVFQGNELFMSWTIGVWMLFTGTGAWLGNRIKKKEVSYFYLERLILLVTILSVISLISITIIRSNFIPTGVIINPAYFIIILLLVVSPLCILPGYIYAILVSIINSGEKGFVRVYALESAGSVAGGLIVSFALTEWFSILQSLLLLVFITTLVLLVCNKQKIFGLSALLAAALLFLSYIIPADKWLKAFLFKNQNILETRETRHGNITAIENSGQYSFFENGSLLFATQNVISNEEYIHYALLQRENPQNILLISGGIEGMVSEIVKYRSVKHIDYVELNPRLIEIVKKYVDFPFDKRINIIYDDGRRYIQNTSRIYDMVILALPDPSSLLTNRFYTDEFFKLLTEKLSENAVVLCSHSPVANYTGSISVKIENVMYNTLKKHFRYVEIIPGGRDYFIASDSSLSGKIVDLWKQHNISTNFVNSDYLNDNLIQQRSALIRQQFQSELVNSDTRPLLMFYHTMQFISKFNKNDALLFLIPLILLVLPLFFLKIWSASLFAAGFTASSFQLLLLFCFQTFYGYIYSAIGIIIGIFMAGLAIGSLIGKLLRINQSYFTIAQLIMLLYSLVFPVFWNIQSSIHSGFSGWLLFIVAVLVLSGLLGFQYVACTVISRQDFNKAATINYAADLFGSALGVILLTLVLLPTAGMKNTCLTIAGLNALVIMLNILRKH